MFIFVKLVRELECYLGNNTESYDGMIAQLKEALDKNTWDGNWFIRAIDDYGDKIGSHSSKEGKIFLNAQAWALIAGVASEEKKSEIIKSVQKYLKTDYGYTLNYPEYTEYDPRIGRLSSIEPGTLENASVYIHGNVFWIMGLLLAGENDLAYQTMQLIDPANPALAGKPSVPYVYANCYYGPSYEKCPGKMEHSWITGAVNWIMLAVIDFMFGVRRNYDGLHIAPSLPAEIKNAGIVRKFRDCEYTINVINNGKNITALYVNGEQADKDKALPYKAGGKYEVRVITG